MEPRLYTLISVIIIVVVIDMTYNVFSGTLNPAKVVIIILSHQVIDKTSNLPTTNRSRVSRTQKLHLERFQLQYVT